MWGLRTSQARTPDRHYRRIRTCLSEEVGTSVGQAPDVRYSEKVGCRPDRMAAVRHPNKVECWSDRISDMRDSRLGGMRDSRSGGMSDATCRKGPSTCPREREPRGTFLGGSHSGWLCKQFKAVLGGCITTKGKTAG